GDRRSLLQGADRRPDLVFGDLSAGDQSRLQPGSRAGAYFLGAPPHRFLMTSAMVTRLLPLLIGLAVAGGACNSHADDVCQNLGDCSHAGDHAWIQSCQAEAKATGAEAAMNGCSAAFDAYYSCADSNYKCVGATATFPGCDAALAALDQCIAAGQAGTACAMLTAAEAGCAAGADAGA